MPKLTKSYLDSVVPDQDRWIRVWDDAITGFHVRVYPSKRIIYKFRYSFLGKPHEISIGRHGTITPAQAREIAQKLAGKVAAGENPAAERRAERVAQTITLMSVADVVFSEANGQSEKYISRAKHLIETHTKGVKDKPIHTITAEDLMAILEPMRKKKPALCEFLRSVLSVAINYSIKKGYINHTSNPMAEIKPVPMKARGLELGTDQVRCMIRELNELINTDPYVIDQATLIKFLILTSARLSEWKDALVENVRLDDMLLLVPINKEGNELKSIDIPEALRSDVSNLLKRNGNFKYIFPSRKLKDKPIWSPDHFWRGFTDTLVEKYPGYPRIQMRDLRKIVLTEGLNLGYTFEQVGAIAGHARGLVPDQRFAVTAIHYAKIRLGTRKDIHNRIVNHIMEGV